VHLRACMGFGVHWLTVKQRLCGCMQFRHVSSAGYAMGCPSGLCSSTRHFCSLGCAASAVHSSVHRKHSVACYGLGLVVLSPYPWSCLNFATTLGAAPPGLQELVPGCIPPQQQSA
jgi:hypothetical protein